MLIKPNHILLPYLQKFPCTCKSLTSIKEAAYLLLGGGGSSSLKAHIATLSLSPGRPPVVPVCCWFTKVTSVFCNLLLVLRHTCGRRSSSLIGPNHVQNLHLDALYLSLITLHCIQATFPLTPKIRHHQFGVVYRNDCFLENKSLH